MPFDFGDIVLVRFPFTSQSAFKQRPAAIVSSQTYNSNRPDVVIMAVTSQLHPAAFGEIQIENWQIANLLKPSAIKPIFATIEKGMILRHLGSLMVRDQGSLHSLIRALLG